MPINKHHTGLENLLNGITFKLKIDGFAKSPLTVMPGLIQHPELIEFTGFWLSPE
jgi:hypothetical protein